MPKVKALATMHLDMEWIGDVPDDIPEDEHYMWVKDNVCGSQYTNLGAGDWTLYDVLVEE